jgi:hypothetical protein
MTRARKVTFVRIEGIIPTSFNVQFQDITIRADG